MDKDTLDVSKSLTFIIDRMLTRDDVREIVAEIVTEVVADMVPSIVQESVQNALKPIDHRLMALENKLSGIDKRLDIEAGHRDDIKIPSRVVDLEVNVFGTSREPQLM